MTVRPRQTDCQHEPAYPDHETVLFSLRDPDMVSHLKTARCLIEYPHLILQCGEYRSATPLRG